MAEFASQNVVGIDADAAGWSLVVRLLRPMALLALLRVLRFGFALGTLEVNAAFADVAAILVVH